MLAGLALAGLGAARSWFPAAGLATALLLLLGLNVVNPEALVVRHNVERAARTKKVDPGYLAQLSDDAVPELVRALPRLPEPARAEVLASVCQSPVSTSDGWFAANASRRRAEDARRQVCVPGVVRR